MATNDHGERITAAALEDMRTGLGVAFEHETARERISSFTDRSDRDRSDDLWNALLLAEAIQHAKRAEVGVRSHDVEPRERLPEYLPEKVVGLHEVLERHGVPYAVGGAIALGYYTPEARGTVDIDIDVFLPPEDHERVLGALDEAFRIPDRGTLVKEIEGRGQGKTHWDKTRIDLFFTNTDYQAEMAGRTRRVPLGDGEIIILSAEDVVITKALFGRPKDWVDILGVLQTTELERPYLERWLDADRLARLDRLPEAADVLGEGFEPPKA